MGIAVYIHVPYCLTKCGYCSFFSVPYSKTEIEKYFQTLKREITLYLDNEYFTAETIYFGGGTPSLLSAAQLREIISMFECEPEAEITLEVNPIQLTDSFLADLATTGVNRLSLGVQSMHDTNLQMLGRKHTAASMPERMQLCRKHHFTNISVDFMYGLPGVSLSEVQADLLAMLALKPKHISTYLLTLEDDVPFAYWQQALPSDDDAADQYQMICATLKQHRFSHYEISNFARPRYRSKHNQYYWLGRDYIGLGAGAHSCIHSHRFANQDDIQDWADEINQGELAIFRAQVNPDTPRVDFIIMQMRLLRGLDCEEYFRRFNKDIFRDFSTVIAKYKRMGFLEVSGKYLRFTQAGLFVSNHILSEFV